MSKYKVGDKVVIRKDLVVGKWYDGVEWFERKEYLKQKDYVVIEEIDVNDRVYFIECDWCINDDMIECLYDDVKDVSNKSKYKKDDKVVIRKDLEDGEYYGKVDWCIEMDYLKEKDYVVIDEIDDGDYWIDAWCITDEMIEGLYEEDEEVEIKAGDKVQVIKDVRSCNTIKKGDIVEIDRFEYGAYYVKVKGHEFVNVGQYYLHRDEFELVKEPIESDKKYIWVSDTFTHNNKEYVYVLDNYKYTTPTIIENNSGFHKSLLKGDRLEFLLTEEQAKQSPLFTSFKPVEITKPMYHVKVNSKYIPIEEHGYMSKMKLGGYVMDKMYRKTKQDRYLFTEEEATELVNNSNGSLIMEKSIWD